MTYALAKRNTAVAPRADRRTYAVKRIFDHSQLIEKFGQWLLICGKSANTQKAYQEAVKQFAKFIDKPLTAATKEDVRGWAGDLYAKARAAATIQARLWRLPATRRADSGIRSAGDSQTQTPEALTSRALRR